MLEKFIHYFLLYNEQIILTTIGLICLAGGLVVYRQVFGPKETANGEFDFSQIEESLRKILAQTNNAIHSTTTAQAASAATGAPVNVAELEGLKKELESRSKLVEELKKQVDSAKGNDGTPELLSKIKTLEGKLAEYEIIEDDIADLSHFKEENAKLKKEIDSLKQGGAALVDQFAAEVAEGGVAAAPASTAPSTPIDIPVMDNIESGQATAAGVATDAVGVSGVVEVKNSLDDAVAAAALQAAGAIDIAPPDTSTPTAQSAAAPPLEPKAATPAPAPAAAPAAKTAEVKEGDIFSEFAGDKEVDPLAEFGEIDTNRMLEELQGLESAMGDASSLDEAPDIEKMASEAQNLKK